MGLRGGARGRGPPHSLKEVEVEEEEEDEAEDDEEEDAEDAEDAVYDDTATDSMHLPPDATPAARAVIIPIGILFQPNLALPSTFGRQCRHQCAVGSRWTAPADSVDGASGALVVTAWLS